MVSHFTEAPSKEITDLFDRVSCAKSVEAESGKVLVDGVEYLEDAPVEAVLTEEAPVAELVIAEETQETPADPDAE